MGFFCKKKNTYLRIRMNLFRRMIIIGKDYRDDQKIFLSFRGRFVELCTVIMIMHSVRESIYVNVGPTL